MKKRRSGNHKLAVEVCKFEGGKKQVDIAQMKETIAKLQLVLAVNHGMLLPFLFSITKIRMGMQREFAEPKKHRAKKK